MNNSSQDVSDHTEIQSCQQGSYCYIQILQKNLMPNLYVKAYACHPNYSDDL